MNCFRSIVPSREFAVLAQQFRIRLSVGRTGQCWDNALAESFFATLKNDLGTDRRWPTRAIARRDLRMDRGPVQHPQAPQQPRLPHLVAHEAALAAA
ncbi:hypothetical protein GCM10023205_53010 [Yinghuangia aomiensis]|uniref:Integrase core domain-containing protein n=1 Tax=Yinghuangia aomiensis TaxID=676205 RepID=A0ABP9HUH2_9ACTN